MNAIGLNHPRHHPGGRCQAFQQKWNQWHMVLLGEFGIDAVELTNVVVAIVARQRHASQHDLCANGL